MLRLLEPAEVVLAGPPNAGKSTLTNVLVGRPVSIVHETPGTTRDWVRELAVLDGVPVWLTDTAGIWDVPSDIDTEAVRRARARAAGADLVLLLSAGEEPAPLDWPGHACVIRIATQCDIKPAWQGADAAISCNDVGPAGIDVGPAGIDVGPAGSRPEGARFCGRTSPQTNRPQNLSLRSRTCEPYGLGNLRNLIVNALGLAAFDASAPMAFTPRQAELLELAAAAIDRNDSAGATAALEKLLRD
jgi:tRNA U34 5-carboxymethylaminomethyl modifying GTPase MnmE/TrmE